MSKVLGRVAVTGATGLIGSNLVAGLVKAGYTDIVVFVRKGSRIPNLERTFSFHGLSLTGSPLSIIESEITDTDSLAPLLSGVDTVFNCAGIIMTGELDARQLIDNNVAVARSVVEAALRSGVKKIVHVSSIAVLGANSDRKTPLTEEYAGEVTERHSAYAQSKYKADLEINKGRAKGLETVIVYPGVVIGEGDWSLNGSSAIIPVISRGLPFYADGVMGYADVRDVAHAMITLSGCEDANGQTFIISGANLSYGELITLGAKAAGKPKPLIRVGKAVLMCGYGIIRALTAMHLMKDRNITRENLDTILYGNRYEGAKIQKICNFVYTSPEETIDRVVKNYLSEKHIKNA